jgi:hypothetical protein
MKTESGEDMSSIENQEENLSETEVSDQDSLKLVPVAESIRYRKRAQSAEKQAEQLAEKLSEAEARASGMDEQLQGLKVEQRLMRKLAAMGAVDLEAVVLIAKSRLESQGDADPDEVVEQLRKDKRHLFVDSPVAVSRSKKTAGVRDRGVSSQGVLEKAAKRAAVTGNRTDLHEYLRLRRNLV